MSFTDTISDTLTRIRNASRAHMERVDVLGSKIGREILEILKKEGYINNFRSIDDGRQGILRVYLKYKEDKSPVISNLLRVSKPGMRVYKRKKSIPKVLAGAGLAIITTSKGVMTDFDARKSNVGGELLCKVW
ncbi:MAG: 30S ribosomal protein S8 [Candidatus Omnitrophica bacterium]|nr:30S ribosomal protein S8 [Candidatus Omnitrophota bacterium]